MRKKMMASVGICLFILFACSIFISPAFAQSTIKASNIVVQAIPGPTVAQQLVTHAQNSWPWYIVRGSGFVAAISLVILILSGIGLVTGYTYKFLEPLTAWATHRALGILFGVSILLHMVGLLFDHFVPFNIMNILVPWLSNYQPVAIFGVQLGSLWVASGVLAFYGTVLVVATSLIWVEKKPYVWKLVHLLSYLVMAFVFVHALFLGTDLANGFLRWVWVATGIAILIAIIYRLRRAKTV